MASFFCKLEALHTLAANVFGVAVDGGATKYLAASDFYWKSVADGGAATLAAAFQTLLRTAPNAVATATVAVSATTGLMTIDWNDGATPHALVWVSAAIRNRCGFTVNFNATAATGANQVKGLWLPTIAPTGLRSSVASSGALISDRRVIKSAAHSVSKVTFNSWHEQGYRFVGLTKAKAYIADEATANESFEQFFTDCLNVGAPFRFYKDRTDDATYKTWDDELPKGLGAMSALKANQDGNWNLELPATEYIHVDTGRGF